MKLKIVNKSSNQVPDYATYGSSGMDLRAFLPEGCVTLEPLERKIIPTGLFMAIEEGYEGQIRPRSGIACKMGLTLINSPGTIDSDYRGEIGLPMVNISNKSQVITNGDRIAQIIFAKYEKAQVVQLESVDQLSTTFRGDGGFGSTGTK